MKINSTKLIKFVNYLQEQNLANKTIKGYSESLKEFSKYHTIVNPININDYFKSKAEKVSTNTLINYKTALKSFTNWQDIVVNWKLINKLIPKVQSRFFPTLDFVQLDKLKDTKTSVKNSIEQRNNLLLEFLFYTGLRLSEIANLKHSDWQNQQLKICGKGNKIRYVFLAPHLVEYLKPNSEEYVFTTSKGKKLSLRSVQEIIHSKVKHSDLNKNISTHSFRRSFATNLYKLGGKLETIKKQLGHASLDTTMKYIHNDFDTLYEDYSKLWK